MYKTVRHGENSLQYTILPQTEEVLNNSGLKGKGRDYSPSIHVRRPRRKSTVKYVLLILFGIVVALTLASVPLYMIKGTLYARRNHQDSHEIITSAPLTPTGREIVKSRKKELKISPVVAASTVIPKLDNIAVTTVGSTTKTTSLPVTTDKITTPLLTMPTLRSWKNSISSTTIRPIPTEDNEKIPLIGTPSGSIRLLDHYLSRKPWEDIIIRPTVAPESITIRNIFKYYSKSMPLEKSATTIKVFDDVLITTKATTARPVTTDFTTEVSKLKDLKETLLSVDDDDEFKESLEVDEVFSLPSLLAGAAADEVKVAKADNDEWYGTRWPYVDPATYFQWTDYSPKDNLLLPLLVAALSSIALVLLLALAVRRRKRSHAASAQIGKLTADLQADDNTNLLTAENPEDAEE